MRALRLARQTFVFQIAPERHDSDATRTYDAQQLAEGALAQSARWDVVKEAERHSGVKWSSRQLPRRTFNKRGKGIQAHGLHPGNAGFLQEVRAFVDRCRVHADFGQAFRNERLEPSVPASNVGQQKFRTACLARTAR